MQVSTTTFANRSAVPTGSNNEKPPKYSGGKLNPAWIAWNEAQNKANGSKSPGTTVPNPNKAPAVISSMDEKMQLENDLGHEVPFTQKLEQTLTEIQNPDYASSININADDIIDELGAIMSKYEIPFGLLNNLKELSTFHVIEFVLDDSGSMKLASDTGGSRKDEALSRVLEMVELLCYIQTPPITFRFLNHNHQNICLTLQRGSDQPRDYFARAKSEIENMWRQPQWSYSTPMYETLNKSFTDPANAGKKVVRYVFGDGVPDNGDAAVAKIKRMFTDRKGPKENPVTFMSCTNKDEDVEWMKSLEEASPFCSESDDYNDELKEVRSDQGDGLMYTRGFYIACELVAAINPNLLDSMDESIPFSKQDFDALQGYVSDEGYRKYFDGFIEASRARANKRNQTNEDRVKGSMNWQGLYNDLCHCSHASDIPAVREYQQRLKAAI